MSYPIEREISETHFLRGRKMKRILLVLVFVLTVAPSWKKAVAEIIHMGISTVGLYELPTEIAKRKGFYKEEGLEVRKVAVRTGLHVAALLAGELDYTTVTGTICEPPFRGCRSRPLWDGSIGRSTC